MKENENKKSGVRITEGSPKETTDILQNGRRNKAEKLKKPLIFALMSIVFLGCMYLIFKPSSDKKEIENIGLNDAVPQATGKVMPADKSKAYEQDMLERKDQEKRNALTTLSDYWNTDDKEVPTDEQPEEAEGYDNNGSKGSGRSGNPALKSYRNAQSTLGSFYQDNNSETMTLRRQLEEMKEKLAEKDVPKPVTVNDQLALMEKSYQMAAKYFPSNAGKMEEKTDKNSEDSSSGTRQKASFAAFYPAQMSIISSLYREPSDSAWLAGLAKVEDRNFFSGGKARENRQITNSIRACIHETQIVTDENPVRIRLLEAVRLSKLVIPKGAVLTAIAKFSGVRLRLLITSIESKGNIIPVEITAYDLDGQPGLAVPSSPERNALTEMVANMGNTSGTSVSLSSTAGQQITTDLSKSVVQGISGYFSKKVRMPKITLKAGYQVFLVAKK